MIRITVLSKRRLRAALTSGAAHPNHPRPRELSIDCSVCKSGFQVGRCTRSGSPPNRCLSMKNFLLSLQQVRSLPGGGAHTMVPSAFVSGCVRGRYAEDSAANSASRRMRAGRCFSGQEGTRDEKPLKQCWLELWALPFDLASRQDLPISSSAHRCLSISAAPSRSGSPNLNLAAAPPADHE